MVNTVQHLARGLRTLAMTFALGLLLPPSNVAAQQAGEMKFTPYEVTDPNFGNMRVATLAIPAGWRATSRVRWDFGSPLYTVYVHVRVVSPDGKMWIELLPNDTVYWLDRFSEGSRVGQRDYGAVYAPNARIDQAMEQLVVRPALGNRPGLQIVAKRTVSAERMANAFKAPFLRGEAMAMRVRYTLNGAPVDEDFFTFYSATKTLTANGPQGTSHEYHRQLLLSHAVGATDGLLPTAYPLLGTVVTSIQRDENFQHHVEVVQRQIQAQIDAKLQRGYESIAAAGKRSMAISANNDALLASMQEHRAAQQRADAARHPAAGDSKSSSDAYSEYIRGTTPMSDPYWGTSEQDSNQRYHWTDSQGNYRASNDPSFNPNIGGGGSNWQRLEPAR